MNLYRYALAPRGAWRTPWQADTLTGRLLALAAQLMPARRFRGELTDRFEMGDPPFVLSDAFPGDLLPVPITLRLQDWREDERKAIKRARWLRPDDFVAAQGGQPIRAGALLADGAVFRRDRLQNSVRRDIDTTGEAGLYSGSEMFLDTAGVQSAPHLSVYARVDSGAEDLLQGLLDALSQEGFGADAGVGYGAFRLLGVAETVPGWDASASANGLCCLSTFQPGPDDPAEGYWEAFVKHGRLGPHVGAPNVFKRPLILLRPGAWFHGHRSTPYLGHTLVAAEFLDPLTARALAARDIAPVHPAFGLTVPFHFVQEV